MNTRIFAGLLILMLTLLTAVALRAGALPLPWSALISGWHAAMNTTTC